MCGRENSPASYPSAELTIESRIECKNHNFIQLQGDPVKRISFMNVIILQNNTAEGINIMYKAINSTDQEDFYHLDL